MVRTWTSGSGHARIEADTDEARKRRPAPTLDDMLAHVDRGGNVEVVLHESKLAQVDGDSAKLPAPWQLESFADAPRSRTPSDGWHAIVRRPENVALHRWVRPFESVELDLLTKGTWPLPGCTRTGTAKKRAGRWEPIGEPSPEGACPEWLREHLLELTRERKPSSNGKHDRARPPAPRGNAKTPRAVRALADELLAAHNAPPGTSHTTLCRAAFNLGQLVGMGELDELEVRAGLETAARERQPHQLEEALRAIDDCLEEGKKHSRADAPRVDPERTARFDRGPVSENTRGHSEGSANSNGAHGPHVEHGREGSEKPKTKPASAVLRLVDGKRDTAGGIIERIERELAAQVDGPDPVFQRGGALVHITTPKRAGKIRRDSRAAVIGLATPRYLAHRAGRCLTSLKLKGKGDARDWSVTDLPVSYAEFLAELGTWPSIPPLEGVIHSPTLRADGSLLARSGYDEESGLLVDFAGAHFPRIPERLDREDAEQALERLARPLRGFPFVHDRDKAVALAASLTALVRRSLPIAPAFGFSAPVRSSGKTKLAKIASAIATGMDPAAMATGRDGEELRKRLFSVLLAGDAVLLIDNVDRPLESAELCAMLTSTSYTDRLLGFSRTVEVSTAATFLLTGNHLSIRGDLASRVLPATMDPRHEFPEQRVFDFDPLDEVLRERAELVAAALIVMRAYVVAGRPRVAAPESRFPEWARMVRDPLVWLGLPDPVETAQQSELDDEERAAVAYVLLLLAEKFRGYFTMADAKRAPALWHALGEAVGSPDKELTAKTAGEFLRPFVDRVVAWREAEPHRSFVLRAGGLTHGSRRFRVEEIR